MPRPLELRDYQVAAVDQLRASYRDSHRAPVLQLVTGGGKTIVFAEVIRSGAHRGRRVLVTAHRCELVRQASEKLLWAGVKHGIIARSLDRDHHLAVQVASIQTLVRRPELLGSFEFVLFDEAHHPRADIWIALLARQPDVWLLGVSATPVRADGKGLGIKSGGCFDDLVLGPSTKELIAAGWLSPVRIFAPARSLDLSPVATVAGYWDRAELAALVDTKAIVGDAIEYYPAHADHQPALAFCIRVDHAEHVAEEFRAAGYRAYCVHGGLPVRVRDDLIHGLASGAVEILTSCALIDEGLDMPAVGGVILLRPAQSLILYRQQIGRCMRTLPRKTALIVNDHVGNTLRHGPPNIERCWSLAGIEKDDGIQSDSASPVGEGQ